ncbi:MAG: efflux RND transporter periplasmic adaptor subunit, partial [Candidatus Levyibacteriota bacterium]
YALQLATLTSPINGVVTAEDVTVPNVNVTTLTSFSVADPNALVFRASVLPQDIDFISVGANVTIKINGLTNKTFQGTVTRIYPQKTTDVNGQDIYQVDITSDQMTGVKLSQTGSVIIQSNIQQDVYLIPTLTLVGNASVWVKENGKIMLKKVTVGKTHENDIEVLNGLTKDDTVITSPKSIAGEQYQVL